MSEERKEENLTIDELIDQYENVNAYDKNEYTNYDAIRSCIRRMVEANQHLERYFKSVLHELIGGDLEPKNINILKKLRTISQTSQSTRDTVASCSTVLADVPNSSWYYGTFRREYIPLHVRLIVAIIVFAYIIENQEHDVPATDQPNWLFLNSDDIKPLSNIIPKVLILCVIPVLSLVCGILTMVFAEHTELTIILTVLQIIVACLWQIWIMCKRSRVKAKYPANPGKIYEVSRFEALLIDNGFKHSNYIRRNYHCPRADIVQYVIGKQITPLNTRVNTIVNLITNNINHHAGKESWECNHDGRRCTNGGIDDWLYCSRCDQNRDTVFMKILRLDLDFRMNLSQINHNLSAIGDDAYVSRVTYHWNRYVRHFLLTPVEKAYIYYVLTGTRPIENTPQRSVQYNGRPNPAHVSASVQPV